MSDAKPEETAGTDASGGGTGAVVPPEGTSPYATGGGGVTFERKVAVQYLAHLLTGDGASELGDGRSVVSVEFQQAPRHPVDDLLVRAARPDDRQPTLVLVLGARRSPKLVRSDESTRKLIRQFVHAAIDAPTDGPEHRLGLVVAGLQTRAGQLAKLTHMAARQMDAPGFFDLVRNTGKFDGRIRGRLDQLERLVESALRDLGVTAADTATVQQHTWELLARLTVSMPRLESPDEADWTDVANRLIPVARGSDLTAAFRLRDRLVALASDYSPAAARVDLKLLRRDAHAQLDPTTRRHRRGWEALDHLHDRALASVRDEITASDGDRRVRLDRSAAAAQLLAEVADAAVVVVTGESGVGKSALALLGLGAAGAASPDIVQTLCINLGHVPRLTLNFESILGCPLSTLLGELSAPQRMLIVDGADAVAEGRDAALRYLVDAARRSDVKPIVVTSVETRKVVRDTLTERVGRVTEYAVDPLSDADINLIVKTFPELSTQGAHPRSRELLRRLVVVDLLVRARVRDVPLTDADAMQAVWSALVRRNEIPDRGSPHDREIALLRLAELDLSGGARLDAIAEIDSAAFDGLRRDGLLRTPPDDPFKIGPEFAHDEVRRYAVARLLLSGDTPASRVLQYDAPRWSLSAARLACQVWLERNDTRTTRSGGRFAALQESFDALVDAGHGARWGDVPGEALLALADPEAVLRDAWPALLAGDAAGLRRLARLIDQRHRHDNRIVDVAAVEPIITLLLNDHAPWASGEHAQGLLRDWLRGHVVAKSGAGHRLRIVLRRRLVEACATAHRLAQDRAAAAAERAARTSEELGQEHRFLESQSALFPAIGYGGRHRPEIPHEITDEIVLELLALLGPDLGTDGEAILRRVARDAPWRLAPALEEPDTGSALARHRPALLAELAEAYYLDDEADRTYDYGIRDHRARSIEVASLAAWYRGPFLPLLRADFRKGVAVLNRLLNHASRFVNDRLVWLWYRGTGVGPDPCSSALQALERACDERIVKGTPIGDVVSVLLDGSESIAMVGLVVGLLVRHLENADHLLDPYLTDPLIWKLEFARVASESHGYAADARGLVAPERRKWSLREAAVLMGMRANEERAVELRTLGEKLVANARRQIESTHHNEPMTPGDGVGDSAERQRALVRDWASSLDRDTYQLHQAHDGPYIQATPPEDTVQVLEPFTQDLERAFEAGRLVDRYYFKRKKGHAQPIGANELAADLASARKLLENPSPLGAHDPWDIAALLAAAALEAHVLHDAELSEDMLSFAVDVVFRIGDRETNPHSYVEDRFFEEGADRSAARAVPLLLLPAAARLRILIDGADGWTTFKRAEGAGVNLAQAAAYEVRLHLSRSLDHVWKTPCAENGRCHHDAGWRIASEAMRHCVLGEWAPGTGRRNIVVLEEPLAESLASADNHAIHALHLDAAIRALGPAAMASICVSTRARELLTALLAAQRRSLLSSQTSDADHGGTHALVSARALLTVAGQGDDAAIYRHIDAYADNSALLGTFLTALSAAAEETPSRAATARRMWPSVVRHVLGLHDSGHNAFKDRRFGDSALASLIPKAAAKMAYLYPELNGPAIEWWDPRGMQPEVEAWLVAAQGRAYCIDHLIRFLHVLAPEDQVRTGFPWVSMLVLSAPVHAAGHSFVLRPWLIEIRSAAEDAGVLNGWQEVVDALVVAGVTELAPYSE